MALGDISALISTIATVIGVILASVATIVVIRKNWGKGFDAEVDQVRQRIESSPETGTADKQYLLLREYHAQGLAQSKISFWFSLVFAAIGFVVIASAIFTLQPSAKLSEQSRTLITLIAGTVIDAVAALFFVRPSKGPADS